MDKLVEAVAEYLCQHRSVGLLRLTLDLTRRRPDLFAEIGAVEVAMGVVSPPTPGTDAWWRAVAAVREAVYVLRERGLAQYVREAEVVNWRDLLTTTRHYRPAQLRGRYFPPFSYFCEAPKNGVSTQHRAKCKTKLHTHRQKDKNHLKTHNNQIREP
jgi:hypothetical protein